MSPWGEFNLGGAALNTQVISATSFANLPSVAAENTIAVITATAIRGFHFTDNRPAGRPAGEVRIKVAGRAVNACEILSDPIISVYPVSVYQTDGSTWTLMEAYLRKSAAWKRIRTYFYQAGTLGLITSLVGANSGAANYAVNSDHFIVNLTAGGTTGFARICPGQQIEISDLSTLKVTYTRYKSGAQGSHTARMVLATTQLGSQNTGVAYVDLGVSTGGATASLDVSALTGLLYMNWTISKTSYYETDYIRVTEVWGE